MKLLNPDISKILCSVPEWHIQIYNNWKNMGSIIQEKTRIEAIHNHTLVLGVYESHWMQELYMLSQELVDAVNKLIGSRRIITVKLKLVEKITVKSKIKPKTEHVFTYRPISKSALLAVENIQDEDLKVEMLKYLKKCLIIN